MIKKQKGSGCNYRKKAFPKQQKSQNNEEMGGFHFNKNRHWNQEEIGKLAHFIKEHQFDFRSLEIRKKKKIYKTMSQVIETKNVNQCRTYVLKLLEKFDSIQKTLIFLEEILVPEQQNIEEQKNQEQIMKKSQNLSNLSVYIRNQSRMNKSQVFGSHENQIMKKSQNLSNPIYIRHENKLNKSQILNSRESEVMKKSQNFSNLSIYIRNENKLNKSEILHSHSFDEEQFRGTGTSYVQENEIQDEVVEHKKRKSFFDININDYGQFQELHTKKQSFEERIFGEEHHFEENFPFVSFQNIIDQETIKQNDSLEQKWKQCHQLFNKYLNCLLPLLKYQQDH